METAGQAAAPQRIWILDAARTLALICMATYHLTYDLQMFGLVPPGTAVSGFFYGYARLIAGSFLFLAGAGLWLSHGNGIRWGRFWRREAKIIAGAALVTLATRIALPEWYVFFGILHAIALGSLLGLAFLRLPGAVTVLTGLAVIAAAYVLPPLVALNTPWLRWIGLHTVPTQTIDLEPLIPWFGPFLIGLGLARLLGPFLPRLAAIRPGGDRLARALAWPGQHSLALYLIHQPVLFGLVWLWVRFAG